MTPYGIAEQLNQEWSNREERLQVTVDSLMRYIQLRLQEPVEYVELSDIARRKLIEKTLKEIL